MEVSSKTRECTLPTTVIVPEAHTLPKHTQRALGEARLALIH